MPKTTFADYRTIPEAARWADRHPETIRRWVRTGLLPAFRVGADRRMLVKQADLEAMLHRVDTAA